MFKGGHKTQYGWSRVSQGHDPSQGGHKVMGCQIAHRFMEPSAWEGLWSSVWVGWSVSWGEGPKGLIMQ